MALGFRAVDRDQVMLLPPDLREWLPDDHLAWLVVDVVGQCDLSGIVSSFRLGSTGREAYDPEMLTALLIYAYSQGVRSSRMIERACVTDVAFRVIAGQQCPDHTTLARFRNKHAEALAGLFGQVLAICGRAGMGRVGVVAIDGSKIAGQASTRRNYSEKTLRKMAADLVREAAETDAAEDVQHGPDGGDGLPDDLVPGSGRAARIRRALELIAEERGAAVATDVTVAEGRVERARSAAQRERDAVVERSEKAPRRRTRRVPIDQQAKVKRADDRIRQVEVELAEAEAGRGPHAQQCDLKGNPSDPETHLMFVRGKGYLQGFNAQIAVSDDHLIVATDVTNETSDRTSFVSMMNQAVDSVAARLGATIATVVADAGYCTIDALTAPGPDRLIATGREAEKPSQPAKNEHIVAMAKRLEPDTPDRAIYSRRQATVEPVFGHLKDRIGLRRFARRGLEAARHELALAAIAHNIRRLATS